MRRFQLIWILPALVALGFGCGSEQRKAPATGSYGPLTNGPWKNAVQSSTNLSPRQPWTNGELAVIQTELSPATLYHCNAKTVSFFADMPETGIGGPTFAAIETEQGPKIFKPGEKIDPARMRESWFVVWWAGASGWTNWDSPWFLTLQHRPASIRFDTNGLHFTFSGPAGYGALMPMYGYHKPLQEEQMSSPFAQLKEKKKRVLTWEWFKALPADPLARARYWASALREFPVHCEESFSVDRARDSVTIRQSFHWISWNDDWNTKHLKLAPVSPVLALALKEGLPAQFSKKPFDMEIPTLFGPFYGMEGVDSYEVTLPLLRYVHGTAGVGAAFSGASNAPCFAAWQKAHGSGDWESVRQQWPALRDRLQRMTTVDWPAFSIASGAPLEHAADAMGAARVAYHEQDANTYVQACHIFARAVVQLCAQQRGVDYFRHEQPWHSMESLGADATLLMTPRGWQISKPEAMPDIAAVPDLSLLWRDLQPMPGERRPDRAPTTKLERLIPGGERTPFLFAEQHRAVEARSFLVQSIEAGPATWPRIVWPHWKTPVGAAWNFGQMSASTNPPARVESQALNPNTAVWTFSQ